MLVHPKCFIIYPHVSAMYLTTNSFSDTLKPNIETKIFPDGDSYVRIKNISAYREKPVALFHRLYPNQDSAILSAVLMLGALKEVGAKVTLVAPYLPYSRQDKIFLEGEALSAQVICRLLADAGASKLVTLDCHFLKKDGEFEYGGLNIQNISANRLLVERARSIAGQELLVVSPDEGAAYLTSGFSGKAMKKARGDYETGDKAYRTIKHMERDFDVEGKNLLVIDDMIATGSTMIKAVKNLKDGGAKKVLCAATHGFFLKDSLVALRKESDGVFTTNSIPNPVAEVNIAGLLEIYKS